MLDQAAQPALLAQQGLHLAAARLGVPVAATLYVGDSVTDIEAARAAGGLSVAALWDRHVHPDRMREARPDFIARTPAEVWSAYLKAASVS